ncbi:hypothetical protein Dimus_026441, partial [Dionaea muscipula]
MSSRESIVSVSIPRFPPPQPNSYVCRGPSATADEPGDRISSDLGYVTDDEGVSGGSSATAVDVPQQVTHSSRNLIYGNRSGFQLGEE